MDGPWSTRCPCHGRGGRRWFLKSLSIQTILWFNHEVTLPWWVPVQGDPSGIFQTQTSVGFTPSPRPKACRELGPAHAAVGYSGIRHWKQHAIPEPWGTSPAAGILLPQSHPSPAQAFQMSLFNASFPTPGFKVPRKPRAAAQPLLDTTGRPGWGKSWDSGAEGTGGRSTEPLSLQGASRAWAQQTQLHSQGDHTDENGILGQLT